MPTSERAGVLPIDKPAGPTSHDMVARARRALGERRIGHTGTLDPFASGLLLLCIGSATRIAEYMSALPKRYQAAITFGTATDTDDATGTAIRVADAWQDPGPERIAAALAAQVGTHMQRPPAYSAKKLRGERLYRMAREGRAPELAPVPVEIFAIRLLAWDPPVARVDVRCGAGTYIRAIARDAGESLGVPAHLSTLRRTAVGAFRVEDAVPGDAIDDEAAVSRAWIAPLDALSHLPRTTIDDTAAAALAHGRSVVAPAASPASGIVAAACDNRLIAIVEAGDGWLRPRKVFA